MAYLRLIYNSQDIQGFERTINTQKRGTGNKLLELMFDCVEDANHANINDIHMLTNACKDVTLKGAAKKRINQFVAIIQQLNEFILKKNATPSRAIKEFVRVLGYNDYLILPRKRTRKRKSPTSQSLLK